LCFIGEEHVKVVNGIRGQASDYYLRH